MIYGSICSGIEAATVAWDPIGWRPAFYAELEPFPSAVLAHHYPHVLNLGDITRFQEWPDAALDVLVGGTPCQSFSVAGLRAGLSDPRGNLALVYLAIADRYRPGWVVWENVPGVLSVDGGRTFAAFIGGLVKLGYGVCWRVLDAQYVRVDGLERAVPQRRRRVFVVGCAGGWQRAAAVLFERESLQWDHPPRRAQGQGSAAAVAPCIEGGGNDTGGTRPPGSTIDTVDSLIAGTVSSKWAKGNGGPAGDECQNLVAHALTSSRASTQCPNEDTTLIAFASNAGSQGAMISHDVSIPMKAGHPPAIAFNHQAGGKQTTLGFDDTGATGALHVGQTPAIAFAQNQREELRMLDAAGALAAIRRGDAKNETLLAYDITGTGPGTINGASLTDVHSVLRSRAPGHSEGSTTTIMQAGYAVRRLTPRECERLQGFPDDYTLVPYRGKTAMDGPRYKALGNSMAVNCMRWIGRRIEMVERSDS